MALAADLIQAARFWAHKFPRMTAAKRLENARADLASGNRRYPGPVKPYAAVSWSADKPGIAYVQADAAGDVQGLRLIGFVEPESSRLIQDSKRIGWYADPYGDGYNNCVGAVYALPGRDGQTRLVAGYLFTDCDGGPTVDLGTVFEGEGDYSHDSDIFRDAARAADHLAQYAAEAERDYQAASLSGSLYSEAADKIENAKREISALLAERKAAKAAGGGEGFGAICAAISREVSRQCDRISEARKLRADLAAGQCEPLYWFTGDSDLRAAFNEAAGLPG